MYGSPSQLLPLAKSGGFSKYPSDLDPSCIFWNELKGGTKKRKKRETRKKTTRGKPNALDPIKSVSLRYGQGQALVGQVPTVALGSGFLQGKWARTVEGLSRSDYYKLQATTNEVSCIPLSLVLGGGFFLFFFFPPSISFLFFFFAPLSKFHPLYHQKGGGELK